MATELAPRKRVRRSASEWQQLVEGWQKTGLSQKVCCERNGIAPSTFGKWRDRLCKDGIAEAQFVELSAIPATSGDNPWQVELQLGCYVVLRLARSS